MKKKAQHKPRTMQLFRSAGYLVDDCERRDPFRSVPDPTNPGQWKMIPGGQTHDLFGLGDLVAVGHGMIALVQICSQTGVSAHKAKARTSDTLLPLLDNGVAFLICGWAKPKHRYVSRLWRAFPMQEERDVWFHEFDADALGKHETSPGLAR